MHLLRLDDTPDLEPSEQLGQLVSGLPGEWHIEGSGPTWRAEQYADGLIRSVGLAVTPEGRVVSWRVEPEISDRAALAVLALSIAAAVLVLAVGSALGRPGWAMLLSAPSLLTTLHIGRRRLRAGLPSTDEPEAALREALQVRVAQTGSGSSGSG